MVRAPHGEKTPALGGSRAAPASGLVLPHPWGPELSVVPGKGKKAERQRVGAEGISRRQGAASSSPGAPPFAPRELSGWQIEASKAAFVLQLCAERWVFVLTPWPRFPTGALSVWEAGLSTSVPIAALWYSHKGCCLCHLCCAEVGQGCPWCSCLSGL